MLKTQLQLLKIEHLHYKFIMKDHSWHAALPSYKLHTPKYNQSHSSVGNGRMGTRTYHTMYTSLPQCMYDLHV